MNKQVTVQTEEIKIKRPVDVVVVNYNAGQYVIDLVKKIKSIKQNNIIVIDNGSVDGSLEALNLLGLTVVPNSENVGFATACNQGARLGHSEIIAFINPDCLLEESLIDSLVAEMAKGKSSLLGCHVTDLDGATQRGTWRRLPTFFRVMKTVLHLEKIPFIQGLNLKKKPVQVEAVNGACFLVRRSAFDHVGGYDKDYPLHFEDLDLFKRLSDAGHTISYADDIKVKHVKGHSSKDTGQVKQWKKTGLLRYFKLHRPSWEYQLIRLLVGLK